MTVFTHSSFPPCSPARVQSLRPCQNQILASFIIQRSTSTLTYPASGEKTLTSSRFPVVTTTKINTRSTRVAKLSPVVEVQSAMCPPLSMNLLVTSLTSSMTAILTPSKWITRRDLFATLTPRGDGCPRSTMTVIQKPDWDILKLMTHTTVWFSSDGQHLWFAPTIVVLQTHLPNILTTTNMIKMMSFLFTMIKLHMLPKLLMNLLWMVEPQPQVGSCSCSASQLLSLASFSISNQRPESGYL